jgi:uncharacterized protein YkwD
MLRFARQRPSGLTASLPKIGLLVHDRFWKPVIFGCRSLTFFAERHHRVSSINRNNKQAQPTSYERTDYFPSSSTTSTTRTSPPMMKSMKSPRSPRSVRLSPSLMTIPEGHACGNNLPPISSTTTSTSTSSTPPPQDDYHHQLLSGSPQPQLQQQEQQPHQQLNDPVFLINTERARLRLAPLTRDPTLDALAYKHASAMAVRCDVHHSVAGIGELQERLNHTVVGENVQRGDSVLSMHYETIMATSSSCINRANLLSCYFTTVGSATVLSVKDGKLYCCQLFRG